MNATDMKRLRHHVNDLCDVLDLPIGNPIDIAILAHRLNTFLLRQPSPTPRRTQGLCLDAGLQGCVLVPPMTRRPATGQANRKEKKVAVTTSVWTVDRNMVQGFKQRNECVGVRVIFAKAEVRGVMTGQIRHWNGTGRRGATRTISHMLEWGRTQAIGSCTGPSRFWRGRPAPTPWRGVACVCVKSAQRAAHQNTFVASTPAPLSSNVDFCWPTCTPMSRVCS